MRDDRLRFRYWLTTDGGPERQASYDEWITHTTAAGVRPGTMRWQTRGAEGRIEYVLPKEGQGDGVFHRGR